MEFCLPFLGPPSQHSFHYQPQSLFPLQILNLSLVLHQGEDDLGLGGQSDSLSTGHAGARLQCCKIVQVPTTEDQRTSAGNSLRAMATNIVKTVLPLAFSVLII